MRPAVTLSLASSYIWVEGMVAGRGWIAIGLVIFSRWRPRLALFGALLFGAIEALIPRVLATGADVPIYTLMMLPYLGYPGGAGRCQSVQSSRFGGTGESGHAV